MLNSKFDINSPEWIDRVFENRNKSYGAYDLRKRSAGSLLKAFGITIGSIGLAVAAFSFWSAKDPASLTGKKGVIDVNNHQIAIVPDATGKKTNNNTGAGDPINRGGSESNDPVHGNEVDVKPMVVGGKETWANFLEKNLRYPEEARDRRLMGIVVTSFIVERDGRISNVNIEQRAGYGFDEEAVRVLKLSPAWIPGRQNGQTVRVKYSLPIYFRIAKK